MPLFAYQQQTQRLIQDVAQKDINPAEPVVYINQARVWLAGDSQAIKALGTYTLTIGSQGPYPFSGITLTGATGVAGVLNGRQQWFVISSGQRWFRSRPWVWFTTYMMNSAAPRQGLPKAWAQYGEGVNGTLYVGPQPDQAYRISADCICVPTALVRDSDPEAIPAPWTTAIPYYAAYLALLSAQTGDKMQAAGKMLQLYEQFTISA